MKIGELVTNETVEHFINVLPPACMNDHCIQIGECSDVVNGRNVYPTVKKVENGWVYAGNCYRGETTEPIEREKYYEKLVEGLEKLGNENIDIAEAMVNSSEDFALEILLSEFDIDIGKSNVSELLSRCHSVVSEEITKFVNEKLKEEKI